MAYKVNTHSKNNKYENSLNIKKNQNPFWTKIYNEYDNFRGCYHRKKAPPPPVYSSLSDPRRSSDSNAADQMSVEDLKKTKVLRPTTFEEE